MSQVAEELKWIESEEAFKDLAALEGMEWEEGVKFAGEGWYTILANTDTREMWAAGPMTEMDRLLNGDFDPFDEEDEEPAIAPAH